MIRPVPMIGVIPEIAGFSIFLIVVRRPETQADEGVLS